jgi:hypothetical protein
MNRVIISVVSFIALSSALAACATDPAEEPAAETSSALTLGPLGPSRCVITQPGCHHYPPFTGRFEDDWTGSGSNPERCLQRAAEYSVWCGNPPGVPTEAVFEAPLSGVRVGTLYVAH